MAEKWKEMANRLRANQEKNLRDYAAQNAKNENRIQELNELQNSMNLALAGHKGRRN